MAKPDSALALTKRRHLSWETMLVVVLVLGLILGRVLSPVFLSSANLSNMLADFTEIALIALPMTLIIVAAEIDLSVASVLGASSALMGVLWHMGLPMPLVIAIVLVAGTLAGLFNGLVIVRFNLPSLASPRSCPCRLSLSSLGPSFSLCCCRPRRSDAASTRLVRIPLPRNFPVSTWRVRSSSFSCCPAR